MRRMIYDHSYFAENPKISLKLKPRSPYLLVLFNFRDKTTSISPQNGKGEIVFRNSCRSMDDDKNGVFS